SGSAKSNGGQTWGSQRFAPMRLPDGEHGRTQMSDRRMIHLIALTAALTLAASGALAFDDAQYPNWKGQWMRSTGVQWDVTKPPGRRQQAPLTPEYQAVYEARLAEQETLGGQDYNPQVRCMLDGMPRAMIGYEPIEFIITPAVTYMRL